MCGSVDGEDTAVGMLDAVNGLAPAPMVTAHRGL